MHLKCIEHQEKHNYEVPTFGDVTLNLVTVNLGKIWCSILTLLTNNRTPFMKNPTVVSDITQSRLQKREFCTNC